MNKKNTVIISKKVYDDLIRERYEMFSRLSVLEGKSGYCFECEKLARKVEKVKGMLGGKR